MSLETIKKKIKEAGQKEIEEIKKVSAKEIFALQEEEAKKVKMLAEETEKALVQEKTQVLEEARIRAEFSRRNFLLLKKRELIDEVFKMVLKNLTGLPAEKKQKFLDQCLEATQQELGSNAKIFAASADREIIKKLLKSYSGFVLAQKAVPSIAGGFRAATAQMELDYSFDNLVLEKREALESEVGRILF